MRSWSEIADYALPNINRTDQTKATATKTNAENKKKKRESERQKIDGQRAREIETEEMANH